MSAFRTWLFGVVAAAMALSILYALLPKSAVLTAARCTGGLIMLLVVVRPLLTLDWDTLQTQYNAYADTIEQQTEAYTSENQKELETIIQSQCAAYISEKAVSLGLTCQAQVECRFEDGVPLPVEVTLDIQKNTALSQILRDELGIDEAHQHWRESG